MFLCFVFFVCVSLRDVLCLVESLMLGFMCDKRVDIVRVRSLKESTRSSSNKQQHKIQTVFKAIARVSPIPRKINTCARNRELLI